MLDNVGRGVFQIPLQLSTTTATIQRIVHKYSNVPADLADACLIHLASELRAGEILTLDHDFEIYRWGGSNRFHILVPLD